MPDLKISEMLEMQKELFEPHKDKWPPMTPEAGRNFLLFMVEEMGEAIAIIKEKGDKAIMDDPNVRAAFCEEMADVLMYYHDTLLRYGITAEEISDAYLEKHAKNMAGIIRRNTIKNTKKIDFPKSGAKAPLFCFHISGNFRI